jgi:hypothetical protein
MKMPLLQFRTIGFDCAAGVMQKLEDASVFEQGAVDVPDELVSPDGLRVRESLRISSGPGTELKRLLASAGIFSGDCQCEARAREMDARGPDWCTENIKTIVGWLAEEARKRVSPFPELSAWVLVRAAIAAARRKAARESEIGIDDGTELNYE